MAECLIASDLGAISGHALCAWAFGPVYFYVSLIHGRNYLVLSFRL